MNNLTKDTWNKEDLSVFEDELYSLRKEDKIQFTKNVVNTKMNVLAISLKDLKKYAGDIYKGNYCSYLDLMAHRYFESTITDAFVISRIKDFNLQKKYILKLSKYIDNWSTVDTLKFNIKGQEQKYLDFSKELLTSSKVFNRRIGIRILFSFTKDPNYTDNILEILKTMDNEEEYYVNMACSWLLCELVIKQRDKAIDFIKSNRNNKFMINKAISKCSDSFRVSETDKTLLKKYRIS